VQVFLSYRRGDVGGHAGRLTDALRQRLGADSVFQDVVAIAPGQDFTVAIDRALDDCDAVLAVIGPGWLTAATPQGAPRLFDADDYVRLELARALDRNVRVVPVLVGGAALPAASELPDDLKGLVRRQAVVLHDETWHQDVNGLVGSLRGEPAVPTTRRPRWLVPGAAVAAVLVVLGAAAWWWGAGSGGGSGGGQQAEPYLCTVRSGRGLESDRAQRRSHRRGEAPGGFAAVHGEGCPLACERGRVAGSPCHQHAEQDVGAAVSRVLALPVPCGRPAAVQGGDLLLVRFYPGGPRAGGRHAGRLPGRVQASRRHRRRARRQQMPDQGDQGPPTGSVLIGPCSWRPPPNAAVVKLDPAGVSAD
jgi:hypothetical protein